MVKSPAGLQDTRFCSPDELPCIGLLVYLETDTMNHVVELDGVSLS